MKLFINNGIITTFHKWSNKRYAAFRSLKVVVKIGVIPVTYCLLVSPTRTFAQTDTLIAKKYDLPEFVINANRKAKTFSELTRVVRVITREEIEKQTNSSLQDVLEKTLLVDIRQRGSQDVQADINIRGGSFDQVLVLLNGVNITDPQTGHHNLNIPIDLNSVQKIEVLQGPGARVYGPGAFSGAINFITEPDSISKITLSTFAGEHGLWGINTTGNISGERIKSFISASRKQSNGYIENTDFEQYNIYSHNTLTTKYGDFSLYGGYQSKGFGANSFYTKSYPNQYEATRMFLTSFQYEKEFNKVKFNYGAYIRNHTDRFELFRSNPLPWYTNHNYHLTNVYGTKMQIQANSKVGRFQVGGELRNEEIISTVLGDTLAKPIKVKDNDSTFYIKGDIRHSLNLFADYAIYLDRFSFSTGLLYSFNNSFKDNWSFGVDFSYIINKPFKAFASINRSFRNPTFTDLYYVGPTNIGNLDIKPENAITYELGLKYNTSTINAFTSIFYRDGNNIIDWVKLPNDTKWQSHNYTNLSTQGLEVGVNKIFNDVFIKSVAINYTYIKASKASGEFDSYYALDYLNHNLVVGINHKIISKLEANWKFSWQDRAGTYVEQPSNKRIKYPAILLTDIKLQWSGKSFFTYIEANNIFNIKYFDIANVEQPGRWLSAGVVFNLKF